MDENTNSNVINEITFLLQNWEEEHSESNYDPIPILTKMAEIIEVEKEIYLKIDLDLFEFDEYDEYPSRYNLDCKMGQVLKIVFHKDYFMRMLLNDYLRDTYYSQNNIIDRDINQLNIAACRLLLDLIPGLETSVIFQDMDTLIHRLIKWVISSIEPLQRYSTGVLAAIMAIPKIAAKFKEENSCLVPLLLQRLKRLNNKLEKCINDNLTPFTQFSSTKSPPCSENSIIKVDSVLSNSLGITDNLEGSKISRAGTLNESPNKWKVEDVCLSPQSCQNEFHKRNRLKLNSKSIAHSSHPEQSISLQRNNTIITETSNSSWTELKSFVIENVQVFPPTIATQEILILHYLTVIAEHQEFLGHAFQDNIALDLILCYVNVHATKETRLAFEALKYLAALLCHKKFSIEFIHMGGLEALLDVPRPSIAATGVSICLYYLGYCEEAMERICFLPKYIITNLVKYALGLVECCQGLGRCQAIMFFGLTFKFKIILDEFDSQDGLRKLHNVISTLPIFIAKIDTEQLNENQECVAPQIVRHVCVAYQKYLEAHLYLKTEIFKRSQLKYRKKSTTLPPDKTCKLSPEEIQENIEFLLQNMPFRYYWAPVDQLLKSGSLMLLLKVIAFVYESNYSGQVETICSALDVLAIACVMPKVQMLFCDKVDHPNGSITSGFNIILGAAESGIVTHANIQKSALNVLVNCVCAPINRVGGTVSGFSHSATSYPNKKLKYTSSEQLIQKVWITIEANRGIMVLNRLLNLKTPIIDADCIRKLTCKALVGICRSDMVRQIVSNLPLITNGQLHHLMRDPILQDKRQEHAIFQKYALELLEKVSGKAKYGEDDLDVSPGYIERIHKDIVVAQTKIQFNDRQLLELIHQHLVTKGFIDTASMLVREANLSSSVTSLSSQRPTKFRYTTNLTPCRTRFHLSPGHRGQPSTCTTDNITCPNSNRSPNHSSTSVSTPKLRTVKLVKKTPLVPYSPSTSVQNSTLQKQVSNESYIRLPVPIKEKQEMTDQSKVTLESVITEYLIDQHARCKNPMATCPQFNLFVPHKCPDPKPKLVTANNFVMRCARRSMGYQSNTMDAKFIHTRFCPVQKIKAAIDTSFRQVCFTRVLFLSDQNDIIVGDQLGEVHIYNKLTAKEKKHFMPHDDCITHIETNRSGDLLLTSSSTWDTPISALWEIKSFDMKIPFNNENYVEFSKAQDRVIGTKGKIATIFDITTGKEITKLHPNLSNHYKKNKATFSVNDRLVLSDGVLFDVNSGKAIHKLDKLNQNQNGVFHPNGLEIISNTEVWDVRTFRMLETVPVLNECSVIFSPVYSTLYAITMERELDGHTTFDTSFKTVDSNDYSCITTIDMKKNIYDLAVNCYDTQIALIENRGMDYLVENSFVRLYDVGRLRDDEDEHDETEDDVDDIYDEDSDDNGSQE